MFWNTVKEIYAKAAPFLLILVLIATSVIIIKLEFDLKHQQEQSQQSIIEMKKFQDDIIRSQTQMTSKADLENYAKDLNFKLDAIKDDMSKMNLELKAINSIQFGSTGYTQNNIPSSNTTPNGNPPLPGQLECDDHTGHCKNPDLYGYLNEKQILEIHEKFGDKDIIVGTVAFDASKKEAWSTNIYGKLFKITNVITQDKNNPDKHVVYNQVEMTVNGQTYKLDVQNAETKEVPLAQETSFKFAPHLHLGIDFKATVANIVGIPTTIGPQITPNLDISFVEWGKPNDPILVFPAVGVGIDTLNGVTPSFSISPVEWNIARFGRPFISNMYLAPSISVNTKGDFAVGAGIKVGL
jgi:hypothetical protein